MKLNRDISSLIIFAILIGFFYYLKGALLPIFLSVILSYLLLPLCNKMEKYIFSRSLSSLISIIIFYFSIIIISYIIFRFFTEFKNILPLDQLKLKTSNLAELSEIWHNKNFDIKNLLNDNISNISNFFLSMAKILIRSSGNIINIISIFLIVPVISYYILNDWYKISKTLESLLPIRYQNDYKYLSSQISLKMRNYLSSQFYNSVILSIIYGMTLKLLGLNYSFYIGFIIGLISFIPFMGQITGLILSLITGYVQYNSFDYLTKLIIFFLIVYIIESNFIGPKLIGEKINIHPAWIIISCIIFGNLYGFVGILFALPVTSILLVIIKFLITQYRKSNIYE